MSIAKKYRLLVVEDAAQAVDSYYTFSDGSKKALGSIGDLGAFSFHETKNINTGEGGMLTINNPEFIKRSEIIWEKGTNRSAFFRGEVDKYGWVDIGSSFLPSEITAAFLWAQLEKMEEIQNRRREIWNFYNANLKDSSISTPTIPDYATNNAHIYYLICKTPDERIKIIHELKRKEITAVFHYLSLHKSPFYGNKHDGRTLKQSDYYSEHLLRLPLFFELKTEDQDLILAIIKSQLL